MHEHILRVVREQQGLTLTQLADMSDLSASQLSMIESGRRMPSLSALLRLARALNLVELEMALGPWNRRRR